MADYSLVSDQSQTNPTTSLIPNVDDNEVAIVVESDNVMKNVINNSLNNDETFNVNSAYYDFYNSLIKFGTSDPSDDLPKNCRIYIKYDGVI